MPTLDSPAGWSVVLARGQTEVLSPAGCRLSGATEAAHSRATAEVRAEAAPAVPLRAAWRALKKEKRAIEVMLT